MANGIGSGVYFNTSATLTVGGLSGSIESFSMTRNSELTEIVGGDGGFLYVGENKMKKVIACSVILTSSGSAVGVPKNMDTATFASPWIGAVSGSWTVTNNPKVSFATSTAGKADIELTQWLRADGSVLA